ncbi:MAG TPA: DEAD/DEAH box helicase [Dehalococcoidia bacterium]|nr:DEAD/DEAH box helicase [Dehalococcoidia bacterium]
MPSPAHGPQPLAGAPRVLDLHLDPDFASGFTLWQRLPAKPAAFAPWPAGLSARLVSALTERGIERPYTHQAEAIEHVLAGRDVVVVTPTASGKTLCYNAPVVEALLREPEARALYLFPTKALAHDQYDELQALVRALGASIKAFTYDGDTPADSRRSVRAAGNIVISNPDMLHSGILPHHTKWMKLFENLRFVVIDELHQYRGVFGSHVANVVRRLHRVCRFYGSNPVFICSSATIGNPGELAEQLLDRPVRVVDRNGAPQGEKYIGVYNPPVVNAELGIRRSALASTEAMTARLVRSGAQTITFAPSRMAVERLVHGLRQRLKAKPGAAPLIEGYRGGYLPNERRAIEAALRAGTIRGVVATTALELGIDIGGLEAAVLAGYPGSLASAWQQMGRSGRRSGRSVAVLVAGSKPLDQYVARHPEYLFETSPESALINRDNLAIRVAHMKAAAFELPFEAGEEFGPDTAELLALLDEGGILHRNGDRYYWMAESYPADGISLRGAAVDNVVIIEQGASPRVIGEVDTPSAPLLVHEEAIYMHGGRQYHVDRLDWQEKKAYVRPVDVDYYTDANLAVDLKVLEVADERPARGCRRAHGDVAVTYLATIFKKIKLETQENVGWGKIHIPQEDMHTTSYWLALSPNATEGMSQPAVEAGLWGVAHLLAGVAPLFLMCDPKDLQVVAQVRSPFTSAPTLFIYESRPGGVGFAEGLFRAHDDLLRAALDLAAECPCPSGCPSCVGPAVDDTPHMKLSALTLLRRLVS